MSCKCCGGNVLEELPENSNVIGKNSRICLTLGCRPAIIQVKTGRFEEGHYIYFQTVIIFLDSPFIPEPAWLEEVGVVCVRVLTRLCPQRKLR